MGERSAQLLVAAIAASRGRPLAKLLVGLGIRHVGPTASIALARELGSPMPSPAPIWSSLPRFLRR
jgi:DNA ligase (NAD+)